MTKGRLVMPTPAVTAATAMESASTATMVAAEAGAATRGVTSSFSAMIVSTECAGVRAALTVG